MMKQGRKEFASINREHLLRVMVRNFRVKIKCMHDAVDKNIVVVLTMAMPTIANESFNAASYETMLDWFPSLCGVSSVVFQK